MRSVSQRGLSLDGGVAKAKANWAGGQLER